MCRAPFQSNPKQTIGKICRAEGGVKNVGFLGEKNRVLRQKNNFFNIFGGGGAPGAPPPPGSAPAICSH